MFGNISWNGFLKLDSNKTKKLNFALSGSKHLRQYSTKIVFKNKDNKTRLALLHKNGTNKELMSHELHRETWEYYELQPNGHKSWTRI